MKRLFLLFCTLLPFAAAMCQEVAGVRFGQSYQECKRSLDQKFNGGESSYQSEPNKLVYYDVTFGGEYFYSAQFDFQSDAANTYLYHISFSVSYDDNQEGFNKTVFKTERLNKLYSKKYKQTGSECDEDGLPYYFFKYQDNDYFVSVFMSKGKNRKGEEKFWATVDYGPVYSIDPQDEI